MRFTRAHTGATVLAAAALVWSGQTAFAQATAPGGPGARPSGVDARTGPSVREASDPGLSSKPPGEGPPPTLAGTPTESGALGEPTSESVTSPPLPAQAPLVPTSQEMYDGAFDALAQGDRALAVSLLQELARADHPLALRAQALLRALTAAPPPPPEEREVPPPPGGGAPTTPAPPSVRTTSAARAEVVFFQTVHGFALGAEACTMLACEDARPWVLSLMLGAGAGFGTTWALSGDGVTPGLARALTDGTLWGAINGGMLLAATDATDGVRDEERVIAAFFASGQLTGLALAAVTYDRLEPSAGQVSLTASGGIWTLVASAELLGVIQPEWDGTTWAWVLLGAGNAGVVAGGWLASEVPMATSRVLLIDAGGILGTLGGLGLAVLAQGDDPEARTTFGLGLAGSLLGLGLSYHLTSDWDGDDGGDAETSPRLGLLPTPDGAQLTVAGRW